MRPGDLLEQRYRLVRVLGRGRSGSVWCARNELIDRAVAIKILHRSLASDPERLQRFFQEARACGRVRHPAVVEVLDLGQGDDGVLFLVMELLEGETLSSLLARKGRLGTDEAMSIIIPLARGLAAAHAHGILHRDLKPANIYLHKTPTGGMQPKILDFGISKILGSELTQSGVVLGTPSYMSPEQARGVADLDPRMDVWSLGVILYECLGGRLPFLAREYRALVEEILERKHVPIEQLAPETPPELARILDEALEKSRERRISSAASFAQKLTTLLRARGGIDLLKEPEDEFSEAAPTLARDRDFGNKPPIDDTVGDNTLAAVQPPAAPPPAETPVPKSPARPVLRTGNAKPTPIIIQPSPTTAAIAAQTSGGKRVDSISVPRPAAGTPARKTGMTGPQATDPIIAEAQRLRAAEAGRKDAGDKRSNTLGWELNVAKAASGRDRNEVSTAEVAPLSAEKAASMLGGSGLPPSSSRIRVDDNWDTTVADVSRESMEASGRAPELADAPLPPLKGLPSAPKVSVAADDAKPTTTSKSRGAIDKTQQGIAAPSPAAIAQVATGNGNGQKSGFGAIPGFTTAAPNGAKRALTPGKTPTIPPAALHKVKTRSAPPGPPPPSQRPPPGAANPPPKPTPSVPPVGNVGNESARLGAVNPALVATKTKPPRPPPKTIPPGAGLSRGTLRPPSGGYAAAMPQTTPSTAPSRPTMKSMPPPPDAPLVAPELFGLGNPDQQGVPIDFMTEQGPAASTPANEPAPPSSSDRTSIPALGPPPNNLEDTDRRARAAMPIVPFLAAAVAVLFVVGAIVGTVAAKSRSSDHAVRRFVNAQMVIITLRDRAQRMATEDAAAATAAANQAAADAAKLKADQDAAAAKLKADQDAADAKAKADADAAAAAASADASASTAAALVAPPPTVTAKPKPAPTSTYKPPAPKPKATTTASPKPKPTSTATTKKTSDPPPKKAKGEKEWWEKKF
jgi:serine/threonine protein kinase